MADDADNTPVLRFPALIGRQIAEETVPTVDARELHRSLGVGKVFGTWIADRIASYGFKQGTDFAIYGNLSFPKPGSAKARTQTTKEYALTLDMAKELAMVERNEAGRQVRRYFIACERALREQAAAAPTPAQPVRVEAHRRARPQPQAPRAESPPAFAPRLDQDGFAVMRIAGEILLVDLTRLDARPGVRAVVIGWDEAVAVQDMSHARRNAKFLGDRNFILPDPTARVGTRSVWAVGTVVATQPAASPGKGAHPRAAKPPRPHHALPERVPLSDLAVAEVCGTA